MDDFRYWLVNVCNSLTETVVAESSNTTRCKLYYGSSQHYYLPIYGESSTSACCVKTLNKVAVTVLLQKQFTLVEGWLQAYLFSLYFHWKVLFIC